MLRRWARCSLRLLRNEFIWKFAKNEKRKSYRTILIVYTHLTFTYTVAHPYEKVNRNADTPRWQKSPREWFQRHLLWIHSWIAFHLWILFYILLKHNKRWNFSLRELSVKCFLTLYSLIVISITPTNNPPKKKEVKIKIYILANSQLLVQLTMWNVKKMENRYDYYNY